MGLDMYLNTASKELARKAYQWHIDNGYWSVYEGKINFRYGTIGYWRKANAIHNWFIKNVQCGTDDNRPYDLMLSDIVELKSVCKKVLDDPDLAEKLLPTISGFFFGSTEYDRWYSKQLVYTYKLCEFLLDNLIEKSSHIYFKYEDEDWDARIEYISSW